MTGTLPADAVSNTYSAPGSLFTLTFELPVQPSVTAFGYYFDVVPEKVRYTLGTEATVNLPDALLSVYDFNDFGMFNLRLSSAPFVRFELSGPVIYIGAVDAPTMLDGTFASYAGTYQSNFYSQFAAQRPDGQTQWFRMTDAVVVQAQTPEPVTSLLVGAALLGLGILRRRFR